MKLKFVMREAFAGLRSNMTMTIAMIITTAISLALLTTGFLLTNMTERTKDIYIDKVEVMVQLDENLSANDKDCGSPECSGLRDKLENDDSVKEVTFRNSEQSYERFVQLFSESDPRLVQQTSPDAIPAALHVRLEDPTETSAIDAVKGMPGVGNIVDQGAEVQEATDNLNAIRNAAFIIAAVQAIASIFLIMNMVQITAFNRRSEVSIMRMVGATRWFTQAPFVIEAMLGALIGSALSVGGLFAAKNFVVDPAMSSLYDANLIARVTNSDIGVATPFVVVLGVLVSAITAQVTLRWYVRR